MKNISLILNVTLLLAVGYLYYLNFSDKKDVSTMHSSNDTTFVSSTSGEIKPSQIVYINADTLFEKYEYVKQIKKETEQQQAGLESSYNSKMQKLQEDFAMFQQKASQGLLSEAQAKIADEDLRKRKEELDQMEMKLNKLMEETQKKNLTIQQKVTDYLTNYNKNKNYNYVLAYTTVGGVILYAKDSLDITNEVIGGLNAMYQAEKIKK